MTWFLRQPLTCLFWIALLCGIAVGLRDAFENWTGLLLFGAMYVVGAWAAVGRANRLARGAILAAAPLVPAAAFWRVDANPAVARNALGLDMLIAWSTFAVTLALSLLLNALSRRSRSDVAAKWQIAIVELLGWTIVAAIASWSASMAHLPARDEFYHFWSTMLTPIPAATIAASFLGAVPRRDRLGVVATAVATAAFFLLAHRLDEVNGEEAAIYAAMFGIVALWALVTRLDEAAAARAATQAAIPAAPPPNSAAP